jgi:hypothetical protein
MNALPAYCAGAGCVGLGAGAGVVGAGAGSGAVGAGAGVDVAGGVGAELGCGVILPE